MSNFVKSFFTLLHFLDMEVATNPNNTNTFS